MPVELNEQLEYISKSSSTKAEPANKEIKAKLKDFNKILIGIVFVLVIMVATLITMVATLLIDSFRINSTIYKEYSEKMNNSNLLKESNNLLLDQNKLNQDKIIKQQEKIIEIINK
jgi:predicted PurR-regulated permease PerM